VVLEVSPPLCFLRLKEAPLRIRHVVGEQSERRH
jgi:hypothetical protein